MIRILFLAANPLDTHPLRLDNEIRAIDEKIGRSEFRDLFDIKQHWAVRISDLQGFLLQHKPDIVHFSGHGSRASGIVLQNKSDNSHPVSVKALSDLFSILKDNIRCVMLNACYSEGQAKAIAEHIECVIGMSKAITDSAAISFAASFYQALGFGRSVQTAFDLARNEIYMETSGEENTPKLLALIANPEIIIFAGSDKLAQDLIEGSDRKRLKVAKELAASAQRHLINLLIERSIADPSPTVRHWINRALGKVGSAEAIGALRRNVIKDQDPFGSLGAYDALKELGIELNK
jgi:hypothetical protein